MSNEKIDVFLNELNSRINVEDVTKRNEIEFFNELMLEIADKYFSKQKLSRKKQKLAKKSWLIKKILISILHQRKS